MADSVVIAIPTFQRQETLPKKTLAYLDKVGFPRERVFVFAQGDAAEVCEYTKTCAGCKIIPSGATGIAHQRWIIRNHFPHGTRVFMLDDDIDKLIAIEGRGLKDILERGFQLCETEGVLYFSVCGYSNDYYMKDSHTTTLKHSVGTVQGFVASPEWADPYWMQQHDQFEDYEFVLRYFRRFGKALRLDWAGVKTKYYSGKGGIGTAADRREAATERAAALAAEYPGWVSVYEKKAPDGGKIANLRFNWRAKPPAAAASRPEAN